MKTSLLLLCVSVIFFTACNHRTPSAKSNAEVANQAAISPISTESPEAEESENKDEYFRLLSATSNSWTAGIPSGGSGTDYYFKIRVTSKEELNFDSAWIDNMALKLFVSKESGAISNDPVKFGNGDEIVLRISQLNNKNSKPELVKAPIPYEGACLISYIVNNTRKYYTIHEIEKVASPNRQ